MTYNEAVQKINSLLTFGIKPGLERISELLERTGSPEKKLRFVHAAGTNGKGSTCALVSFALSCAGYKTGLLISPYVLEFRERFMINGEMIPEKTLSGLVEKLFPITEDMRAEGKIITEFEFVFAIAVHWYAMEKCDVVVLETGLGGRFDATNVIDTPLVNIITSVSLDHTKILGETYAEIAAEKCGILKPGGVCVAYARQQPEAMEVIRHKAAEKNNRLVIADADKAEIISSDIRGTEFIYNGMKLKIRLIGDHQVRNAVTALEALFALRDRGLSIPDEAINKGFAGTAFPARLELLSEKPLILLDGAHNPDGAAALSDAVKKYLDGKRRIGLVGMLADKDVGSALSCLAPLFDMIFTTEPSNPRKMSSSELREVISPYCGNVTACDSNMAAYKKALAELDDKSALVIFGSLYLASDMRKIVLDDLKNGD